MPHIVVMAPRDQEELNAMLEFAVAIDRPVAIRYPRGGLLSKASVPMIKPVELGKAELIRQGKDLAIIAVGSMVYTACEAAACLSKEGIEVTVINARFIKPLDVTLFEEVVRTTKRLVTIEEGVIEGGFGSAILEFIEAENIPEITVKRIGLPSEFIEHGKRTELLTKFNLTSEGICRMIKTEVLHHQWDALR
jgi:1-deoxy-D-xylulose-5-phosphate synthase